MKLIKIMKDNLNKINLKEFTIIISNDDIFRVSPEHPSTDPTWMKKDGADRLFLLFTGGISGGTMERSNLT